METRKRLAVRVFPTVSVAVDVDTNDRFANTIYINDDNHPILIHNEHFTGHVVFRVQDFDGVTQMKLNGERKPQIPNTAYFDDRGRRLSLQVEGRFHKEWSGDQILFGAFFDRRIVVPRGSAIALAMAKYIDPALMGDLNIETPFLCSPLLCGMTAMGVKNIPRSFTEASKDTATFYNSHSQKSSQKDLTKGAAENASSLSLDSQLSGKKPKPLMLPEWAYGGARYLQENLLDNATEAVRRGASSKAFDPQEKNRDIKENELEDIESINEMLKITKKKAKNRRNFFLDEKNRSNFRFSPEKVYGFEFSTTYADLNRFELELGIRIKIEKYLKGQPVRYEARSRDGKTLFWRVELSMEEVDE